MSELIDDSAIDAVGVVWDASSAHSGPRVVDAPPSLRVVRDFLTRSTWQRFAQFILPGVLAHHGRVDNDSGFRFQGDLDPDDDPLPGVELFDPIDTIYLGEGAFDRLMSRFFEAIVDGVTAHSRHEVTEAWWNHFVAGTQELTTRANSTSPARSPRGL